MKTNLFEMPTLSENVAILVEASKQLIIRMEKMIEKHSIQNQAHYETMVQIKQGNLNAGKVELF